VPAHRHLDDRAAKLALRRFPASVARLLPSRHILRIHPSAVGRGVGGRSSAAVAASIAMGNLQAIVTRGQRSQTTHERKSNERAHRRHDTTAAGGSGGGAAKHSPPWLATAVTGHKSSAAWARSSLAVCASRAPPPPHRLQGLLLSATPFVPYPARQAPKSMGILRLELAKDPLESPPTANKAKKRTSFIWFPYTAAHWLDVLNVTTLFG